MNIFVYGDSNVAGWDHSQPCLYSTEQHWPYILQQKLNEKQPDNYKVHTNGVPGRKLSSNPDNPSSDIKQFQKLLKKIGTVDILVLMIGINDFPSQMSHKAVINLVNKYIEVCNAKNTIYVLHPGIFYDRLPEMFQFFTKNHCEGLIEAFNKEQEQINAKIVTFDMKYLGNDGLHLIPEGNIVLAESIAQIIINLKQQ